jgi:mRNA interferase MazF
MKRGDIWTVAGGSGYAGKPRPVIVLQDNRFDATESITICPFTGDPTDAELFRIPIEPTPTNGLKSLSRLMVDKITTVAKSKVGKQIGCLDDEDVVRLNRAVVVFLGLAGSGSALRKRMRAAP